MSSLLHLESKQNSFICPSCKISELASQNNALKCSNCASNYPIINNIPRLVDLENYSGSFGYQWNIHAATQLDSYSKLPISQQRVLKATGWKSQNLKGQTILEAGSGAGRFTEVLLKTQADLYSFDFSSAVEANFANNGDSSNLNLFQGDIFNIPFKNKSFDHVFCLGVIQHTPDPKKAFIELSRKVKPEGYLYIDIYTRSWYHLLAWKYLLRPITMRMNQEKLYRLIKFVAPKLIPMTKVLRKLFGRAGARLMPIVEYSHLGLSDKLNEDWSICDTFDMYSPAHDHPKSKATIEQWFNEAGFSDIEVWYGDNGVVGRGKCPKVES